MSCIGPADVDKVLLDAVRACDAFEVDTRSHVKPREQAVQELVVSIIAAPLRRNTTSSSILLYCRFSDAPHSWLAIL